MKCWDLSIYVLIIKTVEQGKIGMKIIISSPFVLFVNSYRKKNTCTM